MTWSSKVLEQTRGTWQPSDCTSASLAGCSLNSCLYNSFQLFVGVGLYIDLRSSVKNKFYMILLFSKVKEDESLHFTESYKTIDLQKFRSPTWIFLAKEYLFSTVTLNQCRYYVIKPNGRMSACKLKIIGKLECDVSNQLLIA